MNGIKNTFLNLQFIEEPDENPISIGDSIVYSDDDYEDDERRKRQQAAGLIFHPLKEMKAKRLCK